MYRSDSILHWWTENTHATTNTITANFLKLIVIANMIPDMEKSCWYRIGNTPTYITKQMTLVRLEDNIALVNSESRYDIMHHRASTEIGARMNLSIVQLAIESHNWTDQHKKVRAAWGGYLAWLVHGSGCEETLWILLNYSRLREHVSASETPWDGNHWLSTQVPFRPCFIPFSVSFDFVRLVDQIHMLMRFNM